VRSGPNQRGNVDDAEWSFWLAGADRCCRSCDVAKSFDPDFYITCATVIPVRFIAVAVQGGPCESLLRAWQEVETHPRVTFNQRQPTSAAPHVRQYGYLRRLPGQLRAGHAPAHRLPVWWILGFAHRHNMRRSLAFRVVGTGALKHPRWEARGTGPGRARHRAGLARGAWGNLELASGRAPAFWRVVTGQWPLLHSGASRGAGRRERAKARVPRLTGRLVSGGPLPRLVAVAASRAARETSCNRAFAKLTEKRCCRAGDAFHDRQKRKCACRTTTRELE